MGGEYDSPHLFTFLTRHEFKLAFAIAFLQQSDLYADAYPIRRYATPEMEHEVTWEELVRRAVRYLSIEHGFQFEAISPERDGRITAYHQVQPENQMYVNLIRQNGLPHVGSALREAIQMAEERMPGFDTEPMKAALADVERHLAAHERQIDHAALSELNELRRSALAGIGVIPLNDRIH